MSDALRQEIERHLLPLRQDVLGVAVSGGSDSLALLYLLADIAKQHGFSLHVVTVDHGLRSEAADEAQTVKQQCAALSVGHDTLEWRGWEGQGNVQNAARAARYELIAQWAYSRNIQTVALGHTQNDQAETFLMRLARGSGVDGLSAMSHVRHHSGLCWLRPLLDISRSDLRLFLADLGIKWIDDPSNKDTRFERIRARERLAVLEDLGITPSVLSQVACNMRSAREALMFQTAQFAENNTVVRAGALCVDWKALCGQPNEIQRRLIIAAVQWISGSVYPPRRNAVKAVQVAIKGVGTATLDGCILRLKRGKLWVCRELNAVRNLRASLDELWDGRWRVTGPDELSEVYVAALGESGLREYSDWRELGLPRDVLLSTPAFWRGNELVAAPLVKPDQPWQAVLEGGLAGYFDTVISH